MIFPDRLALVRFARARARYYRELYAPLPAEPAWSEVPVIDVERLSAIRARDPEATLTRTPADGWIWTTGGSTSAGKRVAVSAEDLREEARAFRPAFVAAGLEAGDRVANLTWAGELSASFILTGAVLGGLPVLQLPILGRAEPERIVALCRELAANVLVTFPFVAFRIANHLLRRGETLAIEKILHAGEPLLADQREALQRAFKPRIIEQSGYAAVDCGPIAAIDPALGPGVLRPLPGYALVEILDAAGRPVATGEPGRITITNLGRALSPVIRYPLDDLGRWVVPPDDDGSGGAFRLDGRRYRSVKLGFWIVDHADVVAIAAAVPGLSSAVQLVTSRRAGVDWLTLRVAPAAAGGAIAGADAELARRFRARYPAFGDPPGGALSPVLEVELVDAAALAMTAAGKALAIVDGRDGRDGGDGGRER